MEKGKDGSVSVLANSRSSGDQNSKHAAFNRSQIPVCRHPFMAGMRHKYFLQIFILYYIARDVHGPPVSVREPTAAASAADVSVFHQAPSGFTLLQQHGHISLKLVFLFRGFAARDDGPIDLTGDPSLPALLRAGRAERQDGTAVACLDDLGKRQRMNLSPLLTVGASPRDFPWRWVLQRVWGSAALNLHIKGLFSPRLKKKKRKKKRNQLLHNHWCKKMLLFGERKSVEYSPGQIHEAWITPDKWQISAVPAKGFTLMMCCCKKPTNLATEPGGANCLGVSSAKCYLFDSTRCSVVARVPRAISRKTERREINKSKEHAVLTVEVQTLGKNEWKRKESWCHSEHGKRERCCCRDRRGSPGASVIIWASVSAINWKIALVLFLIWKG